MKKVLIIEDEYFSASRLKRLVLDIDDTIEVHGPLKSVTEVVNELSYNNDYDLIFSDIRLVDGDVFDAFREVMPKSFVIFVTAYDEYSMKAIKNNGLDYLMKPIDANELQKAVDKLMLNSPVQREIMENQLKVTFKELQYRERFLVCRGDELFALNVDEINYITIKDNHVFAFTDERTPIPLSLTMVDLEQCLDPNVFFRVNRQYIASLKGIKKIKLFFSSKLVVKLKGCSDENIVVSKEKSALLRKWLDR